jgi:uncharacterized protein YbcI
VPTKGEIEAAIATAVKQFKKEFMGRGPRETRAYLLDDAILVRCKGVLTPAEEKVVQDSAGERARELMKQLRHEVVDVGRPLLEKEIERITKCRVKTILSDISFETAESVFVLAMDGIPRYAE